MMYSIEFDDDDGEPRFIERDDVSVCGRIDVAKNGEFVYFDCHPPAWMLAALADAWQAWNDRGMHEGETP